jgi:hypothetical protein
MPKLMTRNKFQSLPLAPMVRRSISDDTPMHPTNWAMQRFFKWNFAKSSSFHSL